MNNSYIDGLTSPSKKKDAGRRSKSIDGLEFRSLQPTQKHSGLKQKSMLEKKKQPTIRDRNITSIQNDDPLVRQARSRNRLSQSVSRSNHSSNYKQNLSSGYRQRSIDSLNSIARDDFLEPVQSFGLIQRSEQEDAYKQEDFDDFFEENSFDDFYEDMENNKDQNDQTIELDSDQILDKKHKRDKKSKKDKKRGEDSNHQNLPKKKSFLRRHLKLLIVLFIFLVGGLVLYIYGDQLIAKMTGGKSGLFDLIKTAVSEKMIPLKADKNGRTNIAIFGTSGYDMAGSEGRSVHDGAQLTDSLMVMSIDQNAKNAITVSIPRDLKVGREACFAGKVNEVYACASNDGKNEQAGANAVMEEMKKITGMEMHYYVHINWGSLIQIVDALGGITVTVNEDINDYYYTGIRMKAGVPTQLNGEKALGLARARHGSVGGDFTRGENQQRVLIGIKEKIALMKMDIPAMINLMNVLGDNLRTNVNTDEIKTAANVFSAFDPANISSAPLVGLPDGDLVTTANYPVGGVNVSFVIPSAGVQNYTRIQKYLEAKIAEHSDSPETSRILVLNGTNKTGAAAEEKLELEKAGFKVTGTDNAPSGNYTEKITLYSLSNKPQTKQKIEEYYRTTSKTTEELPKGIATKEYDFVVIVGAGDGQNK